MTTPRRLNLTAQPQNEGRNAGRGDARPQNTDTMTGRSPGAVPAYRTRMNSERSDALYVRILKHLTGAKRYRDPHYTARQLAADLHTNTRYVSAAIANSTGDNYNALVNGFRLRDACRMLRSKRHAAMTTEEIGLLSGFSSRQAFYLAFSRVYHMTPRAYRLAEEAPVPAAAVPQHATHQCHQKK